MHKSSFKLEHKRTSTTLSDHVWELKKKKTPTSTLNGRSSKKVKPFAAGEKVHKLCLSKKSFGHCMHKKRLQLNHTNNLQSSDDGPIIVPKLRVMTGYWLSACIVIVNH